MGDRPHVVHLITHIGKGGAATNVLLSAVGLKEKGYSVSVVHGPHPSEESALIECASKVGVEFHLIPSLQREINFNKDRRTISEIRTCLHGLKPDILHTHQSKAGLLGRWISRNQRTYPIVHTPHGHVFYGYFPPWKTRLFVEVERRAAKWCDRLIGLTQREIEDHLKRRIGTRDQWSKIHSGVDIEQIRTLAKEAVDLTAELRIPEGARLHVSIGRLEPVKGFCEFLPLARSTFERIPSLHWAIIGEGSERHRVEEAIRSNGLKGRVHLLGWKENPYPYLVRIEGLWVPSLNEGMGRVIVEAFALGKPVFAANVGSIPELVIDADHGVLFDWARPREVSRLVEGFLDVAGSGDRHEIRNQSAENYSIARMIDQLEECYRGLITKAAGISNSHD